MSQLAPAALVAVILSEAMRVGRQFVEPGTALELEPAAAERLIARGAAIRASDAAARNAAAPREVVREVVKEVVKEIEVRALSKEGTRYLTFKNEIKLVEFIGETADVATIAEFQALEYRREGGPRAVILDAIGARLDAILGAGDGTPGA